jgi:UPF0271 protein
MDIDLNCDLGEGGSHDQELMTLVTSANIACGFHAGDLTMAATALRQAAQSGVCAGAHPGFPDKDNFGRRELERSEQQVYNDCVYQVGALVALARAAHLEVTHIKPHGALYNMACRDDHYARPIVEAAAVFKLPLLGLPQSRLEANCTGRCPFIREGFADRRYRPDGSLVPRTEPNAFVADPLEAVNQMEALMRHSGVRTICVHGDNPQAVAFVRQMRAALLAAGHRLAPFAGSSQACPGRS